MTQNSTQTPPTAAPHDELAFVAAALEAVEIDWQQGYQAVPAHAVAQQYYPQVEAGLPMLILQIDDAAQLARIATALGNAYPAQHAITFVWENEAGEINTCASTIAELARGPIVGTRNALCVPPLPAFHTFSALQEIVAHLRAPAGCPWDRAQTLASLRHDLLSECSEVLEAIDLEMDGTDNIAHIAEELGDLLMAATLMVQIATDEGRFQMADAMASIVTKLRRRHPHIFADVAVDGVDEIITNWDAIKAQEKAAKGVIQEHPLAGVPAALPALEKARQLQSKAAKANLLDRAALAQANPLLQAAFSTRDNEHALGELLWQLVALAHSAGLNPEDALRKYSIQYRAAHSEATLLREE